MVDPFGVPIEAEHCWVDAITAAGLAGVCVGTIYSWRTRGHLERRSGTSREARYDMREVLAVKDRLSGPLTF